MATSPFITSVQADKKIQDSYFALEQKIDIANAGSDLGLLKLTDTPPPTGKHRGDIQTAGTYTNFGDIVFTQEELDNNFGYIYVEEGVSTKVLSAKKGVDVNGVVEEGNTQAVSGGEVYEATKRYNSIYNCSLNGENYTTRQLARNSVPVSDRKVGLSLLYKLNDIWVIERFIGSSISEWENLLSFESDFKKFYVNYLDSKEDTRLQIPLGDRVKGYLLSYLIEGDIYTEYYGVNIYGDTDWQNSNGWVRVYYSNHIFKQTIGDLFTLSGYVIKDTGVFTDAENYLRTDFLPISKLDEIIYSGYVDTAVAPVTFYDINKKRISNIDLSGNIYDEVVPLSDIPVNTRYIIACSTKNFVNKKLQGVTIASVNQLATDNNENLANLSSDVTDNLYSKQYERLTSTEEDGAIDSNGVNVSNSSYVRTANDESIVYDSLKKYAFSGNNSNPTYGGVYCYDENDVFLGRVASDSKLHINTEFTPPIGTYKMRFVALRQNQYDRGIYELIYNPIKDDLENLITESSGISYEDVSPLLTENGAFKENGDIDSSQTSYKRNITGISYSTVIEDGFDYYYSGKIGSGFAGVLFYTATGDRLNTDIFAGEWRRKKITIPFSAKYMSVSSIAGDYEVGVFKGESELKINQIYNQSVPRYNNLAEAKRDFYKKDGLSAVGAYVYNNRTDKIVSENKQIGIFRAKSSKTISNYLIWWDDFLNKGLFKGLENELLESSDFETFTTVHSFTEGLIQTARYTLDNKIIVTIDGVGTLNGGIFKGDIINGFTRVQPWSSDTATTVEHWCLSMINNIIVINEYERSVNTERKTNCAYISYDSGTTFTKIFDFHDSQFYSSVLDLYPDNAGSAHIHGCCYDPYENRVWLATGDKMNKWVLFTDPITDVNNVTWNGMYLDTQFCPLFATRNGIVAGCDNIDNAIYLIHRSAVDLGYVPEIDRNIDNVYTISDDRSAINYVPGIITEIDGLVYSPNNSWRTGFKNNITATSNGVEWFKVWESDVDGGINGNCKIFKKGDGLLIFDKSSNIYNVIEGKVY